MKKITAILLFACIVGQAYAWKPLFAGHRGSYRGVENTEEAFLNGLNFYGYTGLECDIKVTSDKQCVCWHDDDLSRVGHSVSIPSTTLADLQALTLTQTRSGNTYTAKICTADRYLEICKENNAFPIIELKWASGINNNDMSNFYVLYNLIKKHGMEDKAIILTSMQKSLEYVRTNYPKLQCQFLCYEVTEARYEWCKTWGINPSVQTGGLSKYMARKCHDAGMQVGCWTVNSEASYQQHGDLGCYMMTCDYLRPNEMPELEEVDWEALAPTQPIDTLYITELFNHTEAAGTLPNGFPTTLEGDYTQAQQAAYIDGVFYVADYNTDKVICVDTAGVVTDPNISTLNHGICRDDAANLILHTSADVKVPNQLTVYKSEDGSQHTIAIELNNNGQTNFPTASGDIFSAAGGYVYFFPNGQNFVEVVKIAGGKYVSTTSCAVSLTGSTAGYVIPIDNDPNHFIYQVRANGYHLYKNGDKGSYLTSPNGTTAPQRNNSVGGALFELGGHDMFVHMSGGNYKGGWTLRDMTSAELVPMYTQAQLGDGGYYANASVGAFFHWERVDSVTVNLYEYCLGHGVAGWEISTVPHRIRLKDMVIDPTEVTIAVGDTATITAVLTPANAEVQSITWRYATTNRNSKLTSNGITAKFTSKKVGTYTVTALIDDFTAECTVNVVEEVTGLQDLRTDNQSSSKYIQNGQLIILNNGQKINALGQSIESK